MRTSTANLSLSRRFELTTLADLERLLALAAAVDEAMSTYDPREDNDD
jgi:hypothetical protein